MLARYLSSTRSGPSTEVVDRDEGVVSRRRQVQDLRTVAENGSCARNVEARWPPGGAIARESRLSTWHEGLFGAVGRWPWLKSLDQRVSAVVLPLYDRHRDD